MKLSALFAGSLLLLASACCATGPCEGDTCDTAVDGDAWTSIWDGERDPLDAGWRMAGPGAFEVSDGAMTATGGMGLLWYADASYGDFSLSLEWMVEDETDNAGVFVRFPDPGEDPWVAVHQGYELQICDAAGEGHNTGSVYSFQGSTHIPTKPAGEWNHYLITVVGQRYLVHVNGELVNGEVVAKAV